MREYPSPRALLEAHGLRPKKGWGQNFLRERWVLDRIVAVLSPAPGERVIELGAGLGHLSERLLRAGADVVAVERDRDLVPILESALPELCVVAADAKQVDLRTLAGGAEKIAVTGNLPYHLTSPILFHVLEYRTLVSRAVLMMQKEVAERLAAGPGSKVYGVLSVRFGLHARCRIAFGVGPRAFVPQPKVTSSVVRIDFLERPRADPGDPALFRQLVKAAFGQRRKTLQNALKSVADRATLAKAFAEADIDPGLRAEQLPVEAFAALSRALSSRGASPPR
ncbi:MAG: ribosomal RNA small subunit methyltransferase A [Deltaproteobacteria bacterium]|nr:MAG: ribosomal RNA small subunit methyltransferase A [Deltaproteobacteria bacterium]